MSRDIFLVFILEIKEIYINYTKVLMFCYCSLNVILSEIFFPRFEAFVCS